MEVKYITNDLETVIESNRLPKFNEKRKDIYTLSSVDKKVKEDHTSILFKDLMKRDFVPILADIEGFSPLMTSSNANRVYYRKEGHVDAYIEGLGLDPTGMCNCGLHLKCSFNLKNDREMKVKMLLRLDYPPFRVIEDALLLSHTNGEDISLNRQKREDCNSYGLFLASVTKAMEVVEEAKRIYIRMGMKKVEELQRLRNSCYETVADPEFGEIIKLTRRNKYKSALLDAMGRGTDYIFMDR